MNSPAKRKAIVLGIALLCLGLAALSSGSEVVRGLRIALGMVWILCGCMIVLTQFRAGKSALFRLDHFLPFKRTPARLPIPLPASFRVRKLLRRIGPTVLSAPMRRVVQSLCFITFLWLFFYVCWPYHAKPQATGSIHAGWRVARFEQSTGGLSIENDGGGNVVRVGQKRFLVDQSAATECAGLAGRFNVSAIEGKRVQLTPDGVLSAGQLDLLLLGTGPWALHETEPGHWPSHYTDELARKEILPAETFLVIDPLLSLSTALAARSWVWSLASAGVILIVCVFIPRGFCGYLCPLGTLIDLFDWAVGKRVKRFRVADDGWWVHIKYYLLLTVLIASFCGVLVSGFVAAIPVITRGLLFLGEPLQSGLAREWRLVPPMNAGHIISILLFLSVLALGLLRPRFWCKYVCPSGAMFSVANLFRVSERKVEDTCINCNKCVDICPFDAIKPDFTTRVTDCTLCQTCGGVCPTQCIKFVDRWNFTQLKRTNDPPTGETALGRRGFISLLAGSGAGVAGGCTLAATTKIFGTRLDDPNSFRPVRPPGSVPENAFLDMCIRCGECFKACPNNVLQPEGFEQGLEGLWAPMVKADWAGCEPSCNACGQVCPTGAIRALPLAEKKVARMGLAIVDQNTCLPHANREACQLCVDECNAAGYHAIEFIQVHTELDAAGQPIEGTGHLAPVVMADKCVGCGICQTRCFGMNVDEKRLLKKSAIIIKAGEGREDRLMSGSYLQVRENEARQRAAENARQ